MTTEHSVWLMPSGPVRQELASVINALGREYATQLFPPHITLIGQLTAPEAELIERTAVLAKRLKPYDVQLGDVDYLDVFHRALFVHVQETEPVMSANRIAREVFGRSDDKYMPHLSLLYGNFDPPAKESIIARIGRRMTHSFLVDRIYLHSTRGDTSTWYPCGEFILGRTGASEP